MSRELRAAGYGLMCVGFPRSDLVLETVEEDEVYDLQFGRSFAEQARSIHAFIWAEFPRAWLNEDLLLEPIECADCSSGAASPGRHQQFVIIC